MIQRLDEKHRQQVIDFCYERERENLFVLGALSRDKKAFEQNYFWGYFENETLVGLATLFGNWGSFVVNAQDVAVINALTDMAVNAERKLEHVPCFKKYADCIVERLQRKHVKKPKEVTQQMVFTLDSRRFLDFSTGEEIRAKKEDTEEIIYFDRIIEGEPLETKIQDYERKRINLSEIFLLKVNGKIASKANPHGYSHNYVHIGGVGTLKEYRGQGYAKQVVSAVCKYYFEEGVQYALLVVDNENISAQKVYSALGFVPSEAFMIAEY